MNFDELTPRDYLAAQCLLVAYAMAERENVATEMMHKSVATRAYALADAMIDARGRKQP